MKKLAFLSVLFINFFVAAQTTTIPDSNFEQALIDLGYDSVLDGSVLTANINNINVLDVGSKNITSLAGIQDFTSLINLYCNNNLLTSLDVSANTVLTNLGCSNNQITNLDVSVNTALTGLYCNNNNLTSLNVKNGNNVTIPSYGFDATNNPNLTCIEVDDAVWSTSNWTNIDPQTNFSENCHYGETFVPDDNFEQALIDLGYDTVLDDYVTTANINTITNLNVNSKNISDLTGIESFIALTYLSCNNNSLTSIDISQNVALSNLQCYSNQLSSLDITQNTSLTSLYCNDNLLTSLDVSQNTALSSLYCYSNQLTSLDVSSISGLILLQCQSNQLTSLDVSQNTALVGLYCYSNQITGLDVSQNTSLTSLFCNDNLLSNLDVSQNTALSSLYCYSNQLTSLDISQNISLTNLFCYSNQITDLDVSQNMSLSKFDCSSNQLTSLNVKNGNNINFASFNATNNPNLICIEVDNVAWSTTNWTNIDVTASFSENCYTYVPDDNFEQALIDLGYDTVLDDYVITTNINTITTLSISHKNITDLTGIENFITLEYLNCNNNQLTSLDVSNNTVLLQLYCGSNQLTSLDVSNNSVLTGLLCHYNQLTSLDVSQNTTLTGLSCYGNQLTSLDISQNTALTDLSCSSNLLTNLDVSQNTALIGLNCSSNQLINLDISQNTALTSLWCRYNQLTSLNITNNTALSQLRCNNNQLTSLNIANNTALSQLYCGDNQLTSINITNNTALTEYYCGGNQLTSLDVTNNTALTQLQCNNNQLTSLNVKNGNNTNFTVFDAVNNPNLSCIKVDDDIWSTINWVNIDATSFFAEDCSIFTYIPDNNFEQALINLGYDSGPLNDYVLTANINTITNLDVANKNIADLTGIEDFVALEYLSCNNNQLTSLDITNNTSLTQLRCQSNQLTSLNVSQNTALVGLYCYSNQITGLDVSNNTSLTQLFCSINQLTSLDVTNNTALTQLYCGNNHLTSLNVTNNTALTQLRLSNNQLTNIDVTNNTVLSQLYCGDNQLTSLNISNNIALSQLYCEGNQLTSLNVTQNTSLTSLYCNDNLLTSLDVSQNTALSSLYCYSNQLTSLDVSSISGLIHLQCQSNQLTSLDVTNLNASYYYNNYNATENPNLSCIQVDDVGSATTYFTAIDPISSFSEYCGPCVVYIPDANFKSLLVNTPSINTSGDSQIQCDEASAYTGALTVGFASISDLTGIEAFTSITILDLSQNDLTSLDLSQNVALTFLNCTNNSLNTLDLTQNINLEDLYCSTNSLSSLNLAQNTLLIRLSCDDNLLTTLDLTQNTDLEILRCNDNQLTTLNVKNGNNTNNYLFNATNNPSLTCIEVDDTAWSTSNWTNIDPQTSFSENCNACIVNIPDATFKSLLVGDATINANGDSEIQCDEASVFTGSIAAAYWSISDLTGIEAFTSLTSLSCNNNNLTSLDVSQNVALTFLNCSDNPINTLDVAQNINLEVLYCATNSLSSLDLTQNTLLYDLDCNDNSFTTLDLTQNIGLEILRCYDNQLTNLDVSQNTFLYEIDCGNNLLTTLDLSLNTDLGSLICSNNSLSTLDLSQNTFLDFLICTYNTPLNALNVANGNNLNFGYFRADNNPNLTCIEVDDAIWSTSNWTNIDTQTSFSEDCSTTNCTNSATYTSSGWIPNAPTNSTSVIIAFNYDTTLQGANIDACELTIDSGITLTIGDGNYLQTQGNITVNGNLIVEHQGSIVQINDLALTINNGSIQVMKTMNSFDDGTDFSIFGSPMTSETRDGTYTNNNVVMNHITSNFIPNINVENFDPLAENFADDNGDNWQFFSGSEAITPGVGYLVGGITGGGTFTNIYTQGTLNNGTINFNTIYNGTKNGSPNILSNPYASAIDANILITNNSIIDEVYFWEHLTAPTNTYPGYRSENWSMGDISMYNLSGGVLAANGGSIPTQFIASGQGFAIKANAAGTATFNNAMRVTGNNDGYRNESTPIDRLFLKIENQAYHLKSTSLISFTSSATDGFDPKYDAKRLATPISIYSVLGEKELIIQGRSQFNVDHIIPLGFRTQVEEEQNYRISLDEIEGDLLSNVTVYLQDNLLNTITNLSEESYTFSANQSNQKERFVLVFEEEILSNPENTLETISIYPNPTQNRLNIISPQAEITSVSVYDVRGRLINSVAINYQKTYQLDMSILESAMYFVTINTKFGAITKRVVKE